jgi:hypothetical protein
MLNQVDVSGSRTQAFRDDIGLDPKSHIWYCEGEWSSDANKRTKMLRYAKAIDPNAWILWLDGDEILLCGEYLHDHCKRAEEETATGGTALRIVEYDGSVALCYGKLIRVNTVKRYLMSSWELELVSGMGVALPNTPICTAGGIPCGEISSKEDPLLGKNRPPLMGEPHLLHRHGLRNPDREAPRMHDAEAESLQTLVRDAGLAQIAAKTNLPIQQLPDGKEY